MASKVMIDSCQIISSMSGLCTKEGKIPAGCFQQETKKMKETSHRSEGRDEIHDQIKLSELLHLQRDKLKRPL